MSESNCEHCYKRGHREMLEKLNKWLDKEFGADPYRTYTANEIQALLDDLKAEVSDA